MIPWLSLKPVGNDDIKGLLLTLVPQFSNFSGFIMARQVLDLEEWDLVLAKMHRYHANIQQEVGIIVQTIRKEMKSALVPLAEEKANFGKVCYDLLTYNLRLWVLFTKLSGYYFLQLL